MSVEIRERLGLAAIAAALLTSAAAAWLLLAPTLAGEPPDPLASPAPLAAEMEATAAPASPEESLVVDVQGGVLTPGIVTLPAGSRVADALAAAGGYAPDADLAAAAGTLNLAAALSDGQQVYVPLVGMAVGPASGGAAGGSLDGGGSGPVNVNTAAPEALEALPGIGPVTVQKIVAGRNERPFASLEEMVERKVINRGQLEDIRDLVTF